jgi:hypothetical protein
LHGEYGCRILGLICGSSAVLYGDEAKPEAPKLHTYISIRYNNFNINKNLLGGGESHGR